MMLSNNHHLLYKVHVIAQSCVTWILHVILAATPAQPTRASQPSPQSVSSPPPTVALILDLSKVSDGTLGKTNVLQCKFHLYCTH